MKKVSYIILIILILFFSIFLSIYSWSFPEKTDRQVIIDLFNGKIYQWYKIF